MQLMNDGYFDLLSVVLSQSLTGQRQNFPREFLNV